MSKPTMRDRWASRTIRFNTYIAGIAAAALPIALTMTEEQWQRLGLDPATALTAVLFVKVISSMKNMELRGKTDKPLAGRAVDG